MEIDIHGYGKKVERNIQILKESDIHAKNKAAQKRYTSSDKGKATYRRADIKW